MARFISTSRQKFKQAALKSGMHPALAEMVSVVDRDENFEHGGDIKYLVHEGPIICIGDFQAEEYNTLVIGDLIATGTVDVSLEGMDDTGCFIVTGNLICKNFFGNYATVTLIGGDMNVKELVLNSFEDSHLGIGGTLRCNFFLGHDIWANVGKGAEMEYGLGYCLPFHYYSAEHAAILPRHDEESSRQRLAYGLDQCIDPWRIAERIRRGLPVLR